MSHALKMPIARLSTPVPRTLRVFLHPVQALIASREHGVTHSLAAVLMTMVKWHAKAPMIEHLLN